MAVLLSSFYIKVSVFTILLLQFSYAGYKIARNPMLFIFSIWLLFYLSIILFLVFWGGLTYKITMNFCTQVNIEFKWHWYLIENAAELMGILGLWTFAYHYYSTTLSVKEI